MDESFDSSCAKLKKRRSIHDKKPEFCSLESSQTMSEQSKNLINPSLTKSTRSKLRAERENLLLWKQPIKCLYYFLYSLFDLTFIYLPQKFMSPENRKIVLSVISVIVSYYTTKNIPSLSEKIALNSIEETFKICFYWIILGVLSSVGLGTGLHTFLLYLGPFIARVTLAAYECQTTAFKDDSYPDQIQCPGEKGSYQTMAITLFTIMNKVRLESFMWGAGTAIGELPPYFMARAARLASQQEEKEKLEDEQNTANDDEDDDDDEFKQEMKEALEKADTSTLFGKGKAFMHNLVNKVGFFGILLAASIPNPLFDLAGITCGHFLIDFWTFFGATLIGKAIVKMHIQMVFIIVLFSKDKVDWLISKMDGIPKIQAPFVEFMEKQKTKLYEGQVDENADAGLLKNCLEYFVFSMIIYFVISIVHGMAQAQLKKVQKAKSQ